MLWSNIKTVVYIFCSMYSYLVIPFSEYCQEISKVGQIIQDLWRLCNFTRCPSIMKDLPKFEDRTAGLRFKRICSLADCKKKESGTLWTRHNWVFHRHRGRISENDDVQQVVSWDDLFVDIEHLEHCVNLLLAEDRVGRHPLEFLLVHEAVPIHVEYPVIVTSDLISSSAA